MGNNQLRPLSSSENLNKPTKAEEIKPMPRALFRYTNPLMLDNQNIPEQQVCGLPFKKPIKSRNNIKSANNFETLKSQKNHNPKMESRDKFSMVAPINRSLDEFHKRFESIKVHWNKFIKFKKRNFFVDYEVVYEIGSGSLGDVYKVKGLHTGLFRAAKKIYKNKLTEDLQKKLLEEINIMTSLDHPNINKILQVYEQPEHYVILMELCQGGELLNKIVARSLTEKSAGQIIKQILRVLIYIHSKKIVHRDIKPENMMFEKGTNLVKIIDFSIATIKKTDKIQQRLGSPYYIAPEVLLKSYDEKCDLWSCGVILYMIIFGSPPFGGSNEVEIMRNIAKEPIKFQGNQWKKLSPLGKEFLKGLLEKDPNLRFTAAQALHHPWLANIQDFYSNEPDYDCLKNLCRFHFKNRLEAVVLTYIVTQVFSSTEKLPLLKAFMEVDKGSKGVISFDDVRNFIKQKNPNLYKSLKTETVQKLVNSMDLNDSGEIDFSEFLVATIKRNSITREHLEAAFEYFDIDHSGAISFSEIMQFVSNSKESIDTLRRIFDRLDENRDGEISRQEFFKLTFRN